MYLIKDYLLSVDMETLSKFDDAVILSIGLCCIPYNIEDYSFVNLFNNSVEFKLDATDQVKRFNRRIDIDVLNWWKGQSLEAQKILKPDINDIKLDDIPNLIEEYLINCGVGWKGLDIWDRKKFDLWKLQHIYEVSLHRKEQPWGRKSDYDFATIMQWLGGDRYYHIAPSEVTGMIYHSAKADAALDAHRLLKLLHDINFL